MPRIPAVVMCHKLHISPRYKLVKQKLLKAKTIEEEMQKLLKAGAIRKTEFPS